MIHALWQPILEASPPAADATAGLASLQQLAAVRFRGGDARAFLQGYLTCDTDDLVAGRLLPAALCNLQGRVVMNGWCAPDPGADPEHDVLLVLHASLVERLAGFLEKYLKFSRTRLEDLRHSHLVLGTLDLAVSGALELDARRRLFVLDDLDAARDLWDRHPHLSARAWLDALTADRWPLVSEPVSETFLPQMLDLQTLGAINFDKGCYLGQEVVARAQHRGEVKRRLVRLGWRGGEAPAPGSEITDDTGRVRGTVVQSATGEPGGGYLLAVLARDAPHVLRQGDVHLSSAT